MAHIDHIIGTNDGTPDTGQQAKDKINAVIDLVNQVNVHCHYTVTADFTSNEVIALDSGDGSNTGQATVNGDTIVLPANATEFNASNFIISLNGIIQVKGTDVIWDSANSLHFTTALDSGDVFSIN